MSQGICALRLLDVFRQHMTSRLANDWRTPSSPEAMSTAIEDDPACEVPGFQKASDLDDPVLKYASATSKFNDLWNKEGATEDDCTITATGAVPELWRKLLFFCAAFAPASWPLWEWP